MNKCIPPPSPPSDQKKRDRDIPTFVRGSGIYEPPPIRIGQPPNELEIPAWISDLFDLDTLSQGQKFMMHWWGRGMYAHNKKDHIPARVLLESPHYLTEKEIDFLREVILLGPPQQHSDAKSHQNECRELLRKAGFPSPAEILKGCKELLGEIEIEFFERLCSWKGAFTEDQVAVARGIWGWIGEQRVVEESWRTCLPRPPARKRYTWKLEEVLEMMKKEKRETTSQITVSEVNV